MRWPDEHDVVTDRFAPDGSYVGFSWTRRPGAPPRLTDYQRGLRDAAAMLNEIDRNESGD